MRNLKKFLALVLAMVMAMSLMVTANASSKWNAFKDEDVTEEFHEAVDVLAGLGVYQGQNTSGVAGGETKFNPKATITRAETAALIYRIATGDVSDTQAYLYKQYSRLKDVNENAWYAGYVGYTNNAEIIKGSTDGNFYPGYDVTGFQVLAMILRTIGYDQNGEFTGYGWEVRVASYAEKLGILDNLNDTKYANTLNQPANREVVAELLFQTITKVPRVQWTEALGYYNEKDGLTRNTYNPTQGQYIFGLYQDTKSGRNEWGAPYSSDNWRKDGKFTGKYTVVGDKNVYNYVDPVGHPIYANGADKAIATYDTSPKPLAEYFTAVLECQVADDLKIDTSKTYKLFVNGNNVATSASPKATDGAVTDAYKIEATDTVTKVGGQGRWTRFFEDGTCVMIDTMLAEVTTVTDAKLDPAGHIMVPAKMEVTIYDGPDKTTVNGGVSNSKRIISKPSNSKENWEYGKGDMILINAFTNKTARTTQTLREEAAFQTDKVIGANNPTTTLTENKDVWDLSVAPSFTGKQTVATWNTNTHQVNGEPYDDQLCLFLDQAGRATNTTFTWWKDQYGNIIGITANTASFGVITGIYAAFGQGQNDTTGRIKAMATVKFADGTTDTVAIDKFLMSTTATSAPAVITAPGTANTTVDTQLKDTQSTVELWPRYDSDGNKALTVSQPTVFMSASNDALYQGFLYLAPSSVTNMDANNSTAGQYAQDTYGILFDHMFQFVEASDSTVIAIEVAGSTNPATPNEDLYAGLYNNTAGVNPNEGKIYKSLSFMTLSNDNASVGGTNTPAATNIVYLDDNTQFIVNNGGALTTYNGVNDLPGDVTIASGTEVDWADTDGDGRANYVYVTGNIPGVVTYNLFYYDGGAAQWNGTTGSIKGYLDGDDYTATFANYSQFSTVNNSMNYAAHLFALQITNGVVTNVMQAENVTSGSNQGQLILADYTTPGVPVNTTGVVLDFNSAPVAATVSEADNIRLNGTWATAGTFKVGANAGNTYTVNTEAVYWRDNTLVNGVLTNVSYERVSQGHKIVVSGGTPAGTNIEYWIAPNCDIIGELEWLNLRECDVTIVYENNAANSAVQVYISTDPDVTPSSRPLSSVATSPYGSDVAVMAASGDMDTALENAARDTVLYSTALPGSTIATALGISGFANPQYLIYFPFQAVAGISPTLTIRDQDGNQVYAETLAPLADNALSATKATSHAFVIAFRTPGVAAPTNAGTMTGTWPLVAGTTYSFQITYVTANGIVTLSSGSFGMN